MINTGDKINEIWGRFATYSNNAYTIADRIEANMKADWSIGILHKVWAIKNSEDNALKIVELMNWSNEISTDVS